ncbi:hypothetical protein HG537_0F04840 [Torulaspora globosa]|uniref:DH domain-containing protein n=1 Tax=Torulaspora globosa TaxID=48254 RepID=A0A7H9HWP1_9SACH|nr:hypothetical protein HG537_0F04840 [Torulaspora sp. CBS 2947]
MSSASLPLRNSQSNSTSMLNVMNASVTELDSLYYICTNVKTRLERLPQLHPYLNLAYASAEVLSERQSLFLSQKQQQQKISGHQSVSSSFSGRDSHPGANNIARTSSISNFSLKEDISLDSITYSSSQINSTSNPHMEDTLLTFSMGILPISMDCDPVTQLSQLFQQGSPLCIIFNALKPQFKLPVVSSDDIKICKKSIYDFILGCKQHFAFNDEELFKISDVFSNSTTDLMKVLDVIVTLMNSSPDIFSTAEEIQEQIQLELQQVPCYSEYSKIMKEFVATERKYVHDLEILEKYREQLLESNLITSEELYMLFPNLSGAIDFQRRFLVSLEINALIDASKQRIGALFMHSKYFFKLYEPWSIGQNAAIDFLSNQLEKMLRTDFVIRNKMELQSFLYKPVQRLCRYPLLLKELLQVSQDAGSSKELELALEISKGIARSINENQRRTENHEVVKKLYDRVVNWKGYRIAKFGELLYFDKVFISTSGTTEPEREFEVYLFEKIIILFSEVVPKKSASLSLKKKQTNSGSSLTLSLGGSHSSFNTSVNGVSEPKLDLRGRIMIVNLNQIIPLENHSLTITWESVKEQGNFVLKFKNEETRENWSSCLQSLVRNARSESFRSVSSGDQSSFASPVQLRNAHNSITSLNSSQGKHISEMLPKRNTSYANDNEYRSISENYKNSIPKSSLLIRISYNSDFYTVLAELDSSVEDVLHIIQRKLNHSGIVNKVKYQDEDGDFVMLASEDDWNVAKDMLKESEDRILNVWAYS